MVGLVALYTKDPITFISRLRLSVKKNQLFTDFYQMKFFIYLKFFITFISNEYETKCVIVLKKKEPAQHTMRTFGTLAI
jgi:hypothetical protein